MTTWTRDEISLESVNPEDLSATDLRSEAAQIEREGSVPECYRLWHQTTAEVGWLLFSPEDRRAGIAWGSDAVWTDNQRRGCAHSLVVR